MRKWFKYVTTIEELRKRYRELLKLYHPDNENGSVGVTQEINAEYDLVFSILCKEEHSDSQSYTQEENEQCITTYAGLWRYKSMIAENSWYFRNALVRANYNDLKNGIYSTTKFLEMFFENLLMDAGHELKNRYMHVDFDKQSANQSAKVALWRNWLLFRS